MTVKLRNIYPMNPYPKRLLCYQQHHQMEFFIQVKIQEHPCGNVSDLKHPKVNVSILIRILIHIITMIIRESSRLFFLWSMYYMSVSFLCNLNSFVLFLFVVSYLMNSFVRK